MDARVFLFLAFSKKKKNIFNNTQISLIKSLLNSVSLSVLRKLNKLYVNMICFTDVFSTVVASFDSIGQAITYFDSLHCIVSIYLKFPDGFNGPTISTTTMSKLLDGVSVIDKGYFVCLVCSFGVMYNVLT